jgi:hypothetical protein
VPPEALYHPALAIPVQRDAVGRLDSTMTEMDTRRFARALALLQIAN